MAKLFFFILLIFSILTNSSTVKKYKGETSFFNPILTLKDRTACICYDLDLSKNSSFYLNFGCSEIGSKMDKTLYYNFIESCDSKDTCDDIYLNNFKENNDRGIEQETNYGFTFEYEFILEDENKKALLVQYKDFIGEQLIINYLNVNTKVQNLSIVVAIFGIFTLANILPLICIRKKKDE